jgi:hypothetical protein
MKIKIKAVKRPDGSKGIILSSTDVDILLKFKQPRITTVKIVNWMPRLLCIMAILFVSMFALDSFDPKLTFWQQIGGFLIHLLPSFILAFLLFIAWKRELIGGTIFVLLGAGFTPGIYIHNLQMNHSVLMSMGVVLMITFPFIVVGALFILSHLMKKRIRK